MNGAPAKPSAAARSPSCARSIRSASRTYGVPSSGPTTLSFSTSAIVRTGVSITGPTPGLISNGTPMPSSGSMMSANSTAPSTLKRSTGISVACTASSGVCASSMKLYFFRNSRYSGRHRPAWRMNQTGVVSTGCIAAAARKRSRPVISGMVFDNLFTSLGWKLPDSPGHDAAWNERWCWSAPVRSPEPAHECAYSPSPSQRATSLA